YPLAGRRPAEQRERTHERLWRVAAAAELSDRGRPVTLREGRTIPSEHERKMREERRGEPEVLVEPELQRRVRQVVLAPQDVRDLHCGIIDHHGEVVGRTSIPAPDHGVGGG